LIVDDDEVEGNDAEQSDMVSIALNLAYFPDEAVRAFRFGSGFTDKFLEGLKKVEIKKVDEEETKETGPEEHAGAHKLGTGMMNKLVMGNK